MLNLHYFVYPKFVLESVVGLQLQYTFSLPQSRRASYIFSITFHVRRKSDFGQLVLNLSFKEFCNGSSDLRRTLFGTQMVEF